MNDYYLHFSNLTSIENVLRPCSSGGVMAIFEYLNAGLSHSRVNFPRMSTELRAMLTCKRVRRYLELVSYPRASLVRRFSSPSDSRIRRLTIMIVIWMMSKGFYSRSDEPSSLDWIRLLVELRLEVFCRTISARAWGYLHGFGQTAAQLRCPVFPTVTRV